MQKRWIAITAGLIAASCLVGAAFLVFQQIQILAHPPTDTPGPPTPTLQPIDLPRLRAKNSACVPPAHIVPGSYQVDPPQTVGDWLVLTYTVVCQGDGPDRQAYGYYLRADRAS